jgi:hypothetical protein
MTKLAETRRTMVRIMEQYLEALIEKTPGSLPLAENCRATFNGVEGTVGDNDMWRNTLVITQRQTLIDPVSGEMVFFGVMTNEAREMNYDSFPVDIHVYAQTYLSTIRLKIENDNITEVEELVIDKRLRNFYGDYKDIRLPDLEFEMIVPEEERSTREEMIELIETYWDCASKWQPAEAMKVHPDAQRVENGYQTTNHSNSFRGDFKHNKNFRWDMDKKYRFYPVVDPARGLIVSSVMMEGGTNSVDGAVGARVIEAFKIKDGAICHLLAFFPILDCHAGWEREISD